MKRQLSSLSLFALAMLMAPASAFAEGEGHGTYALGAAIAIGLAALGGTLGQSRAIGNGLEAIGRNPSASGKVFLPLILGLALIESLVILSFVIAIGLSNKI